MLSKRLDAGVFSGQFAFAESGVDFVVAYLVQTHDRPALSATQPGREVVQALPRLGRNRTATKRADGVTHCDQSIKGPAGTMPSGFLSSEGEKYPCL